jgi:3-oxoacyl-[acyl-carrier-protein] synthase-3
VNGLPLAAFKKATMSKPITAAITAVGGYVPEDKLTNFDLEKLVDTNDEWIRTRTGIEERRILRGEGKATSDMVVPAVKQICEKRGIDPDEIDCLIVATVTPDMVFPATANLACDKLGAKNAWGFDVSAACSGFLYALTLGATLIESGRYKKVVVCGADKMSAIVDYSDRTTCIIFGDGAGAVLLEPNSEGNGIMDSLLKSDGSGCHYLHMKAGGSLKPASLDTVTAKEHFIYQEGQPVFKFAVKGMADVSAELLERNKLTGNDVAWLVPHQANLRIIDATANRMGLPKEKVMININKYGNTTAGTIPLCLWDWEKQLKKGDNIVLAAFGGGFTWGATLVKWAYNS